MFCVSVENTGLTVLPTHRMVKAPGEFDAQEFAAALEERFEVEAVDVPGATHLQELYAPHQERGDCIGCFVREQKLMLLRPRGDVLEDLKPHWPEALRRLPVAQLHGAILEPLMDIPPAAGSSHERQSFTQDVENLFWAVESTRFDAGFLLPPTQPQMVIDVAEQGERMPPKSTYFYPKIPSGLLFYPYEGGRYTPRVPGQETTGED
jgi:uncharacterized protein (DUF1015 family)